MPKLTSAPEPKFTPSHPSAPWRVYWRKKSHWFTSEAAAQKMCDDIAKGSPAKMTARETDEYLHAKELLAGTPLLHAVRFFIERNPRLASSITVAEAVAAHLEPYREKAVKSGRMEYYNRKVYLMDKFVACAGDRRLSEIGPETLEKLLDAERSDWMRNDLLTHLKILFNRAHRRKEIPDNPTLTLDQVETMPSKVILTLEDAAHVMKVVASMPELIVPVALQLYLGIRTEEITRMDWSMIRIGKSIDLPPFVTKTKERRVIDWWPPVLNKWIRVAKDSGPLMKSPKTFEPKKWRLITMAKAIKPDFKFGQNAFRHTFCSYACAYFESPARAMLLAGQRDVNIFYRHYRDYRSNEDAKKYFGFLK